ncbi:Fatty acyl-CoA reductase wat [Eumeta japonica]|uniref:Fatty acyl-CoA reductase n=1 Tax=Eumeta variegata TaxID=151549 RepID=A0A4C1VUZ3_EUMVA|nr:Fatty acyl-CoA reductase wat [Eumeta japonica]
MAQCVQVNIVFHGAATVKFDERLRAAFATNVLAPLHMLKLARDMKHLNLLSHAFIKGMSRPLTSMSSVHAASGFNHPTPSRKLFVQNRGARSSKLSMLDRCGLLTNIVANDRVRDRRLNSIFGAQRNGLTRLRSKTDCSIQPWSKSKTFEFRAPRSNATLSTAEKLPLIIFLMVFMHVSTAYSNCHLDRVEEKFYPMPTKLEELALKLEKLTDDDIERSLPSTISPWPNTYTFTKALAEHELRRNRESLPLAIFRPAIGDPCSTPGTPMMGICNMFINPDLTTTNLRLDGLRDAKEKSFMHYELLPSGKTIHSDLYCQQLMRLEQEVEKKRSELTNRKGVATRGRRAAAGVSGDVTEAVEALTMKEKEVLISTAKEPIPFWIDNLYGPTGAVVGSGSVSKQVGISAVILELVYTKVHQQKSTIRVERLGVWDDASTVSGEYPHRRMYLELSGRSCITDFTSNPSVAVTGFVRTIHCDENVVADVVPVDLVVNCLIAAARDVHIRPPPLEPPIFNYVSSPENKITWREFNDHNLAHTGKYPLGNAIWYIALTFNKSAFMHHLYIIFLHLLPALVFDCLLTCTGHKPKMLKMYKKIHKLLSVLAYFCTHEISFTNTRTVELWRQTSKEDQRIFPFSIAEICWDDYFSQYIRGIRKYIFHDSEDTLPRARRRWTRYVRVTQSVFGLTRDGQTEERNSEERKKEGKPVLGYEGRLL